MKGFLFTSDWHLRDSVPTCRTDDFINVQWDKVEFILQYALNNNLVILFAGDLFDKAKSSPAVEARLIQLLSAFHVKFYSIAGNHDLLWHNKSQICSYNVLLETGLIKELDKIDSEGRPFSVKGISYGEREKLVKSDINANLNILLAHHLVYLGKNEWVGINGSEAGAFLKKYSDFDLIITGDNHQRFMFEHKNGTTLINPGSLMRQTADQWAHLPAFYTYDLKTEKIQLVNIPIEKSEDVMTREHLERAEDKDARLEAFVKSVKDDYEIGLSFERNLESYFAENKTKQGTQDKIRRVME